MPVAFNPPPFPTADTSLAASVDSNADPSIPADAFAQLLVAAAGDAPVLNGIDAEALLKGKAGGLRGFRGGADASLRLAADQKSAATLLGARDARATLGEASTDTSSDAPAAIDATALLDPAAIAAALNAAMGAKASVDAQADPNAADTDPRDPGDASALQIPLTAALAANAVAAGDQGVRIDAKAAVERPVVRALDARAALAVARPQQAAAPSLASPVAADKDAAPAGPQGAKGKSEVALAAGIAPAAIPVPMSDASAAVATAKELLGDSVSKLKDALERSGSAVSAQAIAMPPTAPATSQPTVHTIDTPVGAPGFNSEFSGKLAQVVMLKNDRAEFHLHPAELGPVDVQISFASDQAVVLITAPHAATRDALEQTLPYLRDMLADQGIQLGQASVQGERNPAEQDKPARGDGTSSTGAASLPAPDVPVRTVQLRGLVDTFA